MCANSLSCGGRARRALLSLSAFGLALALLSPAWGASPDTLARDAGNRIRRAHSKIIGKQFDEAREELAEVAKIVAEIKAADPKHRTLARLERDLQREQADLEKRAGAAGTTTTPAKAPPADAKLPGGVTFRLKKIDQLVKADNLDRAQQLMEEIEKQYAGQYSPDHPDVKAATAAIAELKAKQGAANAADAAAKKAEEEARLQREAMSEAWRRKLATYTKQYDEALNRPNASRLMASPTGDVAELERQKALYDLASKLFDDYKKATFPAGKSDVLESDAKDFERALRNFETAYKQSMERLSAGPEEQLKDALARLKADAAWRTDKAKLPGFVSQKTLDAIRAGLAKAEKSLPAGDAKLAALKKQMAELEALNAEHRRVRCERTFMLPDRFPEADAKPLKDKAAEILKKRVPGAEILRTTIISKDWFTEEVIEYPDPTDRTNPRLRVTRGVTAQVAAKTGDAVLLYTVFVGQDAKVDGSWGPLYGNLHQTAEPMLEKNVNKE